ncbi:MAG: glycosyltransferase family 9 protein [Ignavibacteriaceae bacterium]|nr:glycosyltransferase family 9 protein [Ignavibacteriaceae bacterium]
MILNTNCRHFPGDRPCSFNKNFGTMCNDCINYKPVGFKILIIKFDASGDVLRTTSLLQALKKKYPNSHITWFTKRNAQPIFFNNPFVDEILILENHDTVSKLLALEFDLLIHPDASTQSGAFASWIKAKNKKGFYLDKKGKIQPFDEAAVEWLELGAFDQKKKVNLKTYQQILHEICGLEYEKGEIVLSLSEDEKKFAEDFSAQHDLKKYKKIIGLNTGAGSRWQYKQWGIQQFVHLIQMINGYSSDIGILLYGGEDEKEKNTYLASQFPFIIDTGAENSLRQFFSLVDLSDIFITGDTLGLHAATAFRKKIICLFGPTSSNEIEDYGRITKISPQTDCLVCYKMRCDFSPSCMDLISAEMVFDSLKEAMSLGSESN